MDHQRYYSAPLGGRNSKPPRANMASTINSRSIVNDQEEDAFYFRELEKQGIYLNEAQIKAVRHIHGPLLTIAGAGSGKTSVLVCRTGYLMAIQHVQARNILLVTFTNKAAREMKERISSLPYVSKQSANQVQARTFHSFFLTLLKSRGYDQGILSNERYKQIIIKRILKEMGMDDIYQPEELLALFSTYKMSIITVKNAPKKTQAEKTIMQIWAAYENWKQENHSFDFDDILLESYKLLKDSPSLLKALQNRFRFIMVDEFQDTNLLQYELIKMIAKSHNNLFVVGDDDQTIYSFNGAKSDIILGFDKQYPETETVILDINYRSISSIVGLGNAVICKNKYRMEKILLSTKESSTTPKFCSPSSTEEEAEWIIEDIKQKVASGDRCYSDFVILHRTSSNSRAIFEELTLSEIPFIHFSMSDYNFYEQWPVKTVISYLQLALEPSNFIAIEEILPTLYIKREQGIRTIKNMDQVQPEKNPLIHLSSSLEVKDYQKENIEKRMQLLKNIKQLEPAAAIKTIREGFYDKFLEANEQQRVTIHKEALKETLDELESSARRFKTISTFLTFISDLKKQTKEMENANKDTTDAVSLMTIHRAKGLEFPVVYVIGASEGILPHVTSLESDKMKDSILNTSNLAIEEERRLCYVAITRAEEELYISSPRFYRGKKTGVSRFILEAFQKKEFSLDKKPSLSPTQSIKSKSTQSVLAWICTGKTCVAWQRINTYEEAERNEKRCPLCDTPMRKGEKEI